MNGVGLARWSGTAHVQGSSAPLVVDCVLEGYEPVREERRCLSKREQEHERSKVEEPLAAMMIPLAIAAAPVAPQLAVEAAGRATVYGVSAVASEARTAGKPEYCTYGNMAPNMWPR